MRLFAVLALLLGALALARATPNTAKLTEIMDDLIKCNKQQKVSQDVTLKAKNVNGADVHLTSTIGPDCSLQLNVKKEDGDQNNGNVMGFLDGDDDEINCLDITVSTMGKHSLHVSWVGTANFERPCPLSFEVLKEALDIAIDKVKEKRVGNKERPNEPVADLQDQAIVGCSYTENQQVKNVVKGRDGTFAFRMTTLTAVKRGEAFYVDKLGFTYENVNQEGVRDAVCTALSDVNEFATQVTLKDVADHLYAEIKEGTQGNYATTLQKKNNKIKARSHDATISNLRNRATIFLGKTKTAIAPTLTDIQAALADALGLQWNEASVLTLHAVASDHLARQRTSEAACKKVVDLYHILFVNYPAVPKTVHPRNVFNKKRKLGTVKNAVDTYRNALDGVNNLFNKNFYLFKNNQRNVKCNPPQQNNNN
jgi:hypothetical protein